MTGKFGRSTFVPVALLVTTAVAPSFSAAAVIFQEDFSGPVETSSAWTILNRSTPVGTKTWETGPVNGGLTSRDGNFNFAAVSYESAGAGPATANDWLVLPELPLQNGQRFSFDTISQDGGGYPDRLQVRLNPSNSGADVGGDASSVGDFTVLLLDINPGYASAPDPGSYPTTWTNFSVELSGLTAPGSGRLAFRYFVEDSGPEGSRGTEIAVDNVWLESVPEPSAALLAGAAGLLVLRRPRRKGNV